MCIFLKCREDARRNHVHSAKRHFTEIAGVILHSLGKHLPGTLVYPARQAAIGIEEQVSGCDTLLGEECGIGLVTTVIIVEVAQIEVGENIGIVHKERLITTEPFTRLQYSATGVEQQAALVADVDIHAKAVVFSHIINDFLTEVMHIDYYIIETMLHQILNHATEHRLPGNFHKSLGAVVGERSEARAESGSKYHCFHR